MARGGHADAAQDKKLIKSEMHKAGCSCSKCSGGRVGRDAGGRLPDPSSVRVGNAPSSRAAQGVAQSAMKMTSKQGTDPYNSQPAQASNYQKLWNLRGGRPGRKSGGGNWIAGAVKHPGALHKELGVPQGEKIPAKKLNAAAAKGGKEGERARLAKTLKGLPHKAAGGSLDGTIQGMRPEGGRLARKGGGRTGKKGTTVNIVIAPNPAPRPAMPPPGALPPPGAGPGLGLHQGAPPPMPPPGAMPPQAGAPPPMMPRARGGRTSHMLAKPGAYPLDHASGGGLGRLEKIKAYGKNA
jgi:hypothetical protein